MLVRNLIVINSAGKRDRLGILFSSDKLLVTNRPKAAAEGSGLRPSEGRCRRQRPELR